MITIFNEDKERTVLRTSFLVEIDNTDDFLDKVASYMSTPKNELSDDDILEYIDSNVSLCRSKSPSIFKIMGADTDGPFLICAEKEY